MLARAGRQDFRHYALERSTPRPLPIHTKSSRTPEHTWTKMEYQRRSTEGRSVTQTSISAIQAMVAPAVLITTSGIIAGGLSSLYGAVNDRMRTMTAERLNLRTSADGTFERIGDSLPRTRERIAEIDTQLPLLLRRHRSLGHALLSIYAAALCLVLGVIAIAIAVETDDRGVGVAAVILVVGGTVTLLMGLWFAASAIVISRDAVDYEVQRVLSL
jgi:hypothetical protein